MHENCSQQLLYSVRVKGRQFLFLNPFAGSLNIDRYVVILAAPCCCQCLMLIPMLRQYGAESRTGLVLYCISFIKLYAFRIDFEQNRYNMYGSSLQYFAINMSVAPLQGFMHRQTAFMLDLPPHSSFEGVGILRQILILKCYCKLLLLIV